MARTFQKIRKRLKVEGGLTNVLANIRLIDEKKKSNLRFLILPGSKFKAIWDVINLIFISYLCILTPHILSFEDEIPQTFGYVDTIICLFFALDIIVTFFTAFYQKSELITSKTAITIQYAREYFIIDIISCIPIHILIADETHTDDSQPFRSKRMYAFLILPKLFKLGKVLHFIQMFLDKVTIYFEIRPATERILKALLALIFSVHIFACIWFLTARIYNFGPDTWVIRTGYQDATIAEQYLVSVYWVFQTLTTVGYGDVTAKTAGERIVSLVLMSFGVAFYSSLFQPMDETQKKLRVKMVSLALYAKQFEVPDVLTAKIRNHFEEKSGDFFGQLQHQHLFSALPKTLRGELIQYSYGKTSSIFLFFIWLVYFVKKGIVALVDSKGKERSSYAENTYFGELEFLDKTNRDSTAVAIGEVELYAMKFNLFWHKITKYPGIIDQIKSLAELRRERAKDPSHPMHHISMIQMRSVTNRESALFGESDFGRLTSLKKGKLHNQELEPIAEKLSTRSIQKNTFEKYADWKHRIGIEKCREMAKEISGGFSEYREIVNDNVKETLQILKDIQLHIGENRELGMSE